MLSAIRIKTYDFFVFVNSHKRYWRLNPSQQRTILSRMFFNEQSRWSFLTNLKNHVNNSGNGCFSNVFSRLSTKVNNCCCFTTAENNLVTMMTILLQYCSADNHVTARTTLVCLESYLHDTVYSGGMWLFLLVHEMLSQSDSFATVARGPENYSGLFVYVRTILYDSCIVWMDLKLISNRSCQ